MMPLLKVSNHLVTSFIGFMLIASVSLLLIRSEGAQVGIEDSSDKRSEEFKSRVDEFIHDGFNFKLKQTKEEITKTLGVPEKTKIQNVKNPYYPGEMDEVFELFYQSLYIRIHKVGATRQEFITDIAISGDRYKLKWDLNVGSHKSAVERVLGKPDRDDKDLFEYWSENDSITFQFSNEVVSNIAWNFYLD